MVVYLSENKTYILQVNLFGAASVSNKCLCYLILVSGKRSINDLDPDPGTWVHDPFDLQRMRTLQEILNRRPDV